MYQVPLPCYCSIPTPWIQDFQQISFHHGKTTNTYYNICPYLGNLYEYTISLSPDQNILSIINNFIKI